MLKPLDQTLKVAILVSPGFVMADVLGAHTVFGLTPNTELHLVWKTLDPVESIPPWPTMPTITFDDCPQADVLVVGANTPDVTGDPEVIAFFQQQAQGASAILTGHE